MRRLRPPFRLLVSLRRTASLTTHSLKPRDNREQQRRPPPRLSYVYRLGCKTCKRCSTFFSAHHRSCTVTQRSRYLPAQLGLRQEGTLEVRGRLPRRRGDHLLGSDIETRAQYERGIEPPGGLSLRSGPEPLLFHRCVPDQLQVPSACTQGRRGEWKSENPPLSSRRRLLPVPTVSAAQEGARKHRAASSFGKE